MGFDVTFVELPPYKYGDAPRVIMPAAFHYAGGLLHYYTETGLKRNVEWAHFIRSTALVKRLYPGLWGHWR